MKQILIIFLLTASVSVLADSAKSELGVLADGRYYTESFTVYQIFHDLEGGKMPASGGKAFGKLRYGFEFGYEQHAVGFYRRRETDINYSPDTASILYLDKNDIALPDKAEYSIDLNVDDIQFDEYQYRFAWRVNKRLLVTPALSFIYANDLIKGRLYGCHG